MARSELIPVDALVRALAEAKTPQARILLASKAEALRHFAQRVKLGLDAQNRCAETKLRAERQLGGLLAETARSPGQRDQTFQLERQNQHRGRRRHHDRDDPCSCD
jgi:hypothetical protein